MSLNTCGFDCSGTEFSPILDKLSGTDWTGQRVLVKEGVGMGMGSSSSNNSSSSSNSNSSSYVVTHNYRAR